MTRITSKKLFNFRVFTRENRGVRLEPGDSVASIRPLCSAGRRNGVGAAWLYCAASTSRFFRSAANFFNGFCQEHIGGLTWFHKAGSWDVKSDSPPFF
jgi:hypothetical protein